MFIISMCKSVDCDSACPVTGKLVFRLVRPDGKKQELLCEAAINNHLGADKWHNLAINVRDSVQKRKVVIEVSVILFFSLYLYLLWQVFICYSVNNLFF